LPSSATVSQYRDSLAATPQFNMALSGKSNGPRAPLGPLQLRALTGYGGLFAGVACPQ
jgi:hypothetical protein